MIKYCTIQISNYVYGSEKHGIFPNVPDHGRECVWCVCKITIDNFSECPFIIIELQVSSFNKKAVIVIINWMNMYYDYN